MQNLSIYRRKFVDAWRPRPKKKRKKDNRLKKYVSCRCTECPQAFTRKDDLKHHCSVQHNQTYVKCESPQSS